MGKKLKTYADWRLSESMFEYNFYVKQFKRLLYTMFKWSNLPIGVTSRFVERTLYHYGKMVLYKDAGVLIMSRCTEEGINRYEEPLAYNTLSITGNGKIIKADKAVPLYNDAFKEGNVFNVNFFAKKISNIEKTIDVNLEQLKQPSILSVPEGQKLTAEQLWQKKTNGEPIILVTDDFMSGMEKIDVFDLKIKNYIPDLDDTKMKYINQALTFFGINNVNIQKRERLITGEAEQNDEQINYNLNAMLRPREEFCEAANKKFNIYPPISVEVDKEAIEENVEAIRALAS